MDVHQQYLKFMNTRSGTLSEQDTAVSDSGIHDQESKKEKQRDNARGKTATKDARETKEEGKRWGSRDIVFEDVRICNDAGEKTTCLEAGKPFQIEMDYKIVHPVDSVSFGVGIFRNDGLQCYGTNTNIDHQPIEVTNQRGTVVFDVSINCLLEGQYLLDVAIHRPDGFPYDYFRECISFTVTTVEKDVGVMRLPHVWKSN